MELKYQKYVEHLRKIQDIKATVHLLQWDMEVYASSKGAVFRGQQIATLSATAHQWLISDEFGALLHDLHKNKSELSAEQAINIEKSLDKYLKETKLPTEFVKAFSTAQTSAFQAWIKARKANDFSIFKNDLNHIVQLSREKTRLLGFDSHPYDALLDIYESGATVEGLDALFAVVKKELIQLVNIIAAKGTATDNTFLNNHYDTKKQWEFGIYLLKQMGYDFEAGRQDISEHPFTTTFSPKDVRITTRIEANNPIEMIGGCVHEGGHALYEQGLNPDAYGLPLGQAISLGIHESQSRLWENHVGLSLEYWKANYPKMQAYFPEVLNKVSLEQFYKAINQIAPNHLRTIADEVHYHLHVLIRYEIEKRLMEGSLEVDDLEAVWNQQYKEVLGLQVNQPSEGVLQDVHWAEGLFGYFPTYSLGSFYAAQFFHQASVEIPDLDAKITAGNMQPLLDWLRNNIHIHGQRYSSEELCKKITGETLNIAYFVNYLHRKYAQIYDFETTSIAQY